MKLENCKKTSHLSTFLGWKSGQMGRFFYIFFFKLLTPLGPKNVIPGDKCTPFGNDLGPLYDPCEFSGAAYYTLPNLKV